MTNLKACRFCGETDHLHVHADYFCDNDQFVFDACLNLVRGPTGEPLYREDDAIECLVCNGLAPRTMWQADEASLATIRLRTLEAWKEYDDKSVWVGLAQERAA